MTQIKFTKCQSLRNDFIVVDAQPKVRWSAPRVRHICDRRSGVGADGLIVLDKRQRAYDFKLFNSDGTRAEWSGNGIRCAAVSVAQHSSRQNTQFHTAAGHIETSVKPSRSGWAVSFERPFPSTVPLGQAAMSIQKSGLHTPISIDAGNPHWVFIVDDFNYEWEVIGEACQALARKTHGVNVEFVRIVNAKQIELRLYERGVGPTPSSGSGALAAFAACRSQELVSSSVRVISPGGDQTVSLLRGSGEVRMTAQASVAFKGFWNVG